MNLLVKKANERFDYDVDRSCQQKSRLDECGKILRDSKDDLDIAFAEWSVLKLPIPGLDEAIKPD